MLVASGPITTHKGLHSIDDKKVSTPAAAVNFINVLRACFSHKILAPKITKLKVIREKLLNLLSYKKRSRKMLMKLMT